jgi:hypothetical protein
MAQLQPLDIVAPGAFGLNTERKNQLLTPEWATTALNSVINKSGRIAARKGWADQASNAISGSHQVDTIYEYIQEDGTSTILSCANNVIYKNFDYTDAANDITSATTPTGDHWQFINFNNKVIGVQRGHTPVEWSGSGDFADQSYTGTGPDGNAAVAAFGRVWAADADLQTIRVSVLLDDTDYSTGNGGGTIDMSSVWTGGMDEIVALAAVGANLVVFGKNHIVMWGDGSGSQIGMSLANAHIVDTIEGTGCIARDSIQVTGEGDIIFLSRHGLQSLGRVIQFKSNPTITLTKHVRSDILESISVQRATDSEMDQVKATHSPEEGLYIITFPLQDKQYVVDTHHAFQDDEGDELFPITTWQLGGTIVGLCTTVDGKLYFGSTGTVGKYTGQDDDGSVYDFEMQTGWLDLGEANHVLKMLKEINSTLAIGLGTVVYTWAWDFDEATSQRSVDYISAGPSEFNVAEFSDSGSGIGYADPAASTLRESEFSGAAGLQRKTVPAYGEGQFIKLGVTASIDGFECVVQQMSISAKFGRMIT